jgi:hypothetical protein
MSASVKMVIRDPSKFGMLATQVKLDMIKAGINTVNIMAAQGRKEAHKNIKKSFITRNTWTTRQVQFTQMPQSKYVKINAIASKLGATESDAYMQRQEEGGKHKPSKGSTLAIPTDYARGGSKRRRVISSMYASKITKKRRVHGISVRDYNSFARSKSKAHKIAKAYVAFKYGLFLPIGDTRGRRNIFVVTSFRKNKNAASFKLKQVYRFDKPETTTYPEPWLLPASEKVGRQAQAIFNSQMDKI